MKKIIFITIAIIITTLFILYPISKTTPNDIDVKVISEMSETENQEYLTMNLKWQWDREPMFKGNEDMIVIVNPNMMIHEHWNEVNAKYGLRYGDVSLFFTKHSEQQYIRKFLSTPDKNGEITLKFFQNKEDDSINDINEYRIYYVHSGKVSLGTENYWIKRIR
ncbi:hypothetical protein R9X47_00195 [Wukongibacter baidiensis]|uniref:hypothetical protein n=1 Tax=Wukongibacter baidiensis TaxID=1723361 RepID=UPI003D7FDC45